MPHEVMNEQQVAAYLHLDAREVTKLASRGQIPARRQGERFVFRKSDVDHWVETQMHELGRERLGQIERGVRAHHGFEEDAMLLTRLIPEGGIAVPLPAKTRSSVLRGLVDLADACHLVWAQDELLQEIEQREDLMTTGLVGGVAFPHPRHPLPYSIAQSFVVVGLTSTGVPFGALDGSLTRLFFLICCKDDRTHLHVLARLAQILHDEADVQWMLEAQSADELRQTIRDIEARIS